MFNVYVFGGSFAGARVSPPPPALNIGQTLMVQVAKRGASVLKRRKSRNRMEAPGSSRTGGVDGSAASSSQMATQLSGDGGMQTPAHMAHGPPRSESDGDVVFYSEEPRAGGLWFWYSVGVWRVIAAGRATCREFAVVELRC